MVKVESVRGELQNWEPLSLRIFKGLCPVQRTTGIQDLTTEFWSIVTLICRGQLFHL